MQRQAGGNVTAQGWFARDAVAADVLLRQPLSHKFGSRLELLMIA